MYPFSQKFYWLWFLAFTLIFVAQVLPLIHQWSPNNDEPIELTTGYLYWKGDLLTHDHHPPVSKVLQALPLRFLGLNADLPANYRDAQQQAYDFFFRLNRDKVETMVQSGRLVSLLFGISLGACLFALTRQGPFIVMFCALFLWAFHPTFLVYSALCLADLPLAFFFFLAVWVFQKHLKEPGPKWALLAGTLTALAACSKYSGLALIPLFALLEWRDATTVGAFQLSKKLRDWSFGAFAFLALTGIIFLPGTLFIRGHFHPWFFFWNGLQNMMAYSNYHHPTYFWGIASGSNHWLYFPATFLLKNTIPFLFLLFLTGVTVAMGKQRFPFWLWFSPFFFFICILPVQNLGVRYLLPILPFLILMAAQTLDGVWENRWGFLSGWKGQCLMILLLVWHAASVLAARPNLISYFNEMIAPQNKARYLADNDLDVGQDVKRLAEVGKTRGWKSVKLAQFGGTVDPSFYGLPVESWTKKDLAAPQPGQVYAVNISLFQIGPLFWSDLLPIARSWALNTPPTGKVGDTWFYFEIPGKPQADSSPRLNSIRVF